MAAIKKFLKLFSVYVYDREIAERIVQDAKESERSESKQIIMILKKYYREHKK